MADQWRFLARKTTHKLCIIRHWWMIFPARNLHLHWISSIHGGVDKKISYKWWISHCHVRFSSGYSTCSIGNVWARLDAECPSSQWAQDGKWSLHPINRKERQLAMEELRLHFQSLPVINVNHSVILLTLLTVTINIWLIVTVNYVNQWRNMHYADTVHHLRWHRWWLSQSMN